MIDPGVASVTTGIIAAVVTLVGVLMSNSKQRVTMEIELRNLRDEMTRENEVTRSNVRRENEVTREDVAALSKHVEKHNGIIERVYKLESDSSTMRLRIDELREEIKNTKIGGTE